MCAAKLKLSFSHYQLASMTAPCVRLCPAHRRFFERRPCEKPIKILTTLLVAQVSLLLPAIRRKAAAEFGSDKPLLSTNMSDVSKMVIDDGEKKTVTLLKSMVSGRSLQKFNSQRHRPR